MAASRLSHAPAPSPAPVAAQPVPVVPAAEPASAAAVPALAALVGEPNSGGVVPGPFCNILQYNEIPMQLPHGHVGYISILGVGRIALINTDQNYQTCDITSIHNHFFPW